MVRSKIAPCLWFDGKAEQAAKFYVSIFKNGRIKSILRWGEAGRGAADTVLLVEFTLDGVDFLALNGGPEFHISEAISFSIDCDSQEEVDCFWDALTRDGGQPSRCGWLKDKFGVSWQVVPNEVSALMNDPDPERRRRAFEVLMTMDKLWIDEFRRAVGY